MKKSIATLAVLPFMAVFSPVHAASETVGSDALVVEPIQFALLLEMNFGRIAPNPLGGSVVLDATNGERDCSNAAACVGDFSVSELQVSGSDAQVTVTFSPSLELTGPGDAMTVTPELPGGSGQTFTLSGGSLLLRFGATLTTNANQAPGAYSGPFTVDVSYQ